MSLRELIIPPSIGNGGLYLALSRVSKTAHLSDFCAQKMEWNIFNTVYVEMIRGLLPVQNWSIFACGWSRRAFLLAGFQIF